MAAHEPLARTFTTSLGVLCEATRGPKLFGFTYDPRVGATTLANTLGKFTFRKSDCTFASNEGTGGMAWSIADRMLDCWIPLATDPHVVEASSPATSQQPTRAPPAPTTTPAIRSTIPRCSVRTALATMEPTKLPNSAPTLETTKIKTGP